MSKKPFMSELDEFLHQFDQSHPQRSSSQQLEIAKSAKIIQQRDNANADEEKIEKWWAGF